MVLISQVISGNGNQVNQIELSCSGHKLSKNIPHISHHDCGKAKKECSASLVKDFVFSSILNNKMVVY